MIKAVLFDLDGTLVPMDTDEFIQAYFASLGKFVASCGIECNPKAVLDSIMKSTAAVISNRDAKLLNSEVFWKTFEQLESEKFSQFSVEFEKYYSHIFDEIGNGIKPIPHASELVETLKSANKRLVVATNPLFPLIAVKKRLAWVGIDPDDFELITDFESLHYTKPHVEYYLEILDMIGLNAKECVMIGNDVCDDILPAQGLGMTTFFLDTFGIHGDDLPKNTPHGGYEELLSWSRELL